MNELKWMKSKLIKMEVIYIMNSTEWAVPYRRRTRSRYERMGLFETLQIKSINMYGYEDTIGFGIYYNKAGLYGWDGKKSKDFLFLKNPMD